MTMNRIHSASGYFALLFLPHAGCGGIAVDGGAGTGVGGEPSSRTPEGSGGNRGGEWGTGSSGGTSGSGSSGGTGVDEGPSGGGRSECVGSNCENDDPLRACDSSIGCDVGYVCACGNCTRYYAACKADDDCEMGQHCWTDTFGIKSCVNVFCESEEGKPCDIDDDCPTGLFCWGSECVRPRGNCSSESDCPSGTHCCDSSCPNHPGVCLSSDLLPVSDYCEDKEGNAQADLTIEITEQCPIEVQACNLENFAFYGASFAVHNYGENGPILCSGWTTMELEAGQCEVLPCDVEISPQVELFAEIGGSDECDETNNSDSVMVEACSN